MAFNEENNMTEPHTCKYCDIELTDEEVDICPICAMTEAEYILSLAEMEMNRAY
jgi:hypothetical protein